MLCAIVRKRVAGSATGQVERANAAKPVSAQVALRKEHPMSDPHRSFAHRSRLLACVATLFAAPLAQATSFGTQLLANGDAESGNTAGWASTGIDVVSSGIAGSVGLADGVSVGSFSFTGGTGSAASQSLTQTVGLEDIAERIDASQVSFSFSALIQSRRNTDVTDTARASLRFRDAGGAVIASFDFFDADVPLDVNDWSFVSLSQGLPTGTRAVQVLLDVSRSGGASSDGFFDNVGLSVSAVPEPEAWGLMAPGLCAVWARAGQKQPATRPAGRLEALGSAA
jgi:hypothetical protein